MRKLLIGSCGDDNHLKRGRKAFMIMRYHAKGWWDQEGAGKRIEGAIHLMCLWVRKTK